jgi:hypothetical protein
MDGVCMMHDAEETVASRPRAFKLEVASWPHCGWSIHPAVFTPVHKHSPMLPNESGPCRLAVLRHFGVMMWCGQQSDSLSLLIAHRSSQYFSAYFCPPLNSKEHWYFTKPKQSPTEEPRLAMGVSCRMLPLQMPRAGRRHAVSHWAELTLYHS